MIGIKYLGFRMYPSKYNYLFKENSKSFIGKILTSSLFIGTLIPSIAFVSLILIDSLNLYFIAPGVLWLALSASSVV